ncbi:MAG TPA: universal stress protein [Hyphomicrobiales bacterium]|nr:universal stress protein [Hyphomicrobiales bacterium]
MGDRKPRTLFVEGHKRKFLVIVDDSPECETALFYAARRAERTGGGLALLFVIHPPEMSHWLGVEEAYREEQYNKARAVFRLHGRKLRNWGFSIVPEEIIREGQKAEEIVKLIEEDRDFGILVLGASTDPSGPGPLVSSLAAGTEAGAFPIPITIVPGTLTLEEVKGLA